MSQTTYTETQIRAALSKAAIDADDDGESVEVSILCDVFCQTLFGAAPYLDADGVPVQDRA